MYSGASAASRQSELIHRCAICGILNCVTLDNALQHSGFVSIFFKFSDSVALHRLNFVVTSQLQTFINSTWCLVESVKVLCLK